MKRDNSLRKMSSWTVKKDPKGTKKPQHLIESKVFPKMIAPYEEKKKKRNKQRKVSLLRASPSRPGSQRCSGSSSDDAAEMGSSSALRSPRPRAPVVPGLLDVSPPPPVDTPNSMRRKRLSGRGRPRQLRCRNRGCANTERTFSSERARERHEQESCSMRIQVMKTNWSNMQ